jgi:hypothetical protein
MISRLLFFISIVTFFVSCSVVEEVSIKELFNQKILLLENKSDSLKKSLMLPKQVKIEKTELDTISKSISISFSKEFAVIPFREDNVDKIYTSIKNIFGDEFLGYTFNISTIDYPIEELIPNAFRTDVTSIDSSRLPIKKLNTIPIVQNVSKSNKVLKGLNGRNILLWHSHGWYYNNNEKRWMWQRARLFQTVEDLGPLTFTIPYLIPMLENAGANVFVPRERDINTNEIVVDNDYINKNSYHEQTFDSKISWRNSEQKGFGLKELSISESENPFLLGTARRTSTMKNPLASVSWLPKFSQTGNYAVYISYSKEANGIDDAHYKVLHSGGETEFLVNQKIGGGTWIYLGTFKFDEGDNNQGVVLTNQSKDADKVVSADAVRFGGGMGIVERVGIKSNRPKFVEGSRYWLQYAGMPDTLTFSLNKNNDDYKDDYQSRAEYGNYLFGNPYGPNKNRKEKGLGIPIDLSLAFHTDAGITKNDTAIGTLMIYSIPGLDSQKVFPDGVNRIANRDLADIVQSEIVNDIRFKYDSSWTRRQLMNAIYSEAARPNFPSILLELLSHQNYYEMKFALDPKFRFDVSRSIYKGMLKYLSSSYGFDYVVQPLPPTDFSVLLNDKGEVELSWIAQFDSSEITSEAKKFIIYTRIENGGFDNGRIVESNKITLNDIKENAIYSYKVTAINDGGESFPTEILSVCWNKKSPEPVLIVYGFDRISAPATFDSPAFSGFINFEDEGVPDKYELGFTGNQFNFDPNSKWETDDNPGHGASHSDYESRVIAGNTFDFTFVHGKAIKENGFSFCSSSDESVMSGKLDLSHYSMIDFIFGEEKKTSAPKYKSQVEFEVFPMLLREKISEYLDGGGKIFLSGAYLGTDLYSDKDSSGIRFANNLLKFRLKTDHAVKKGKFYSINEKFSSTKNEFEFNTVFTDSIYKVEAPDELGNVKDSEILLRYSENNFSAGVGYKDKYGVVVFGFPFETVLGEKQRTILMKSILNYLDVK